jgi:hypothetical protein
MVRRIEAPRARKSSRAGRSIGNGSGSGRRGGRAAAWLS